MEKRVVIGTLSVLIALAVIGFVIYMAFYHESNLDVEESENEVVALTPYGQSLSESVDAEKLREFWLNIKHSDAAYLQNPDFDMTADNFQQCFYDFLTAPARLYFFSTDDLESDSNKCDSPEIRVKFADVFQDVFLTECSEEKHTAMAGTEYNAQINLNNVTGTVDILCYRDYSCIQFSRYFIQTDSYATDYFYANENLHDKVMTIYEKVKPYSMEEPMEETN